MNQTTLNAPAILQGTALFTALPCRCIIHPADPNTGLAFLHNTTRIPVCASAISSDPVHPVFANIPPRCTAVSHQDTTVWLVEHVLSALAGLGITNALIEVDHHELPIFDGSSLPFVSAIQAAGIKQQSSPINPIRITKPIRVEHNDPNNDDKNDAWIEATPSEQDSGSASYQYTIDYGPDSPITQATVRWDSVPNDYTTRIAHARTFCLKHEADALSSAGLFKDLNPSDMLVLDNDGPIDNTLRDPRECALHKLLDLIGDVALLGTPILANIKAHKSGHALAHDLARAIENAQ